MGDIPKHNWVEMARLKKSVTLSRCSISGEIRVIKLLTPALNSVLPIGGNEYVSYKVSYKLMMLLKSKGIDIEVAKVELETSTNNNLNRNIALIEYLGEHSRIDQKLRHNYKFPNWLYWFDRWIGRLDSNGDTNLLLIKKTRKVIPVDFAMAYHWACGVDAYCLKVDNFNVPISADVTEARSSHVKEVIQSITDQEIKSVIFGNQLNGFIPITTRVAYYTGLCYRRDNLK